ncbi:MAG: hypothetical protein WCL00_06965 [Bacteroidota bacterium]
MNPGGTEQSGSLSVQCHFLEIKDAAIELGVSSSWLRSLCKRGLLPYIKENEKWPFNGRMKVDLLKTRETLYSKGLMYFKEGRFVRIETRGRKPIKQLGRIVLVRILLKKRGL